MTGTTDRNRIVVVGLAILLCVGCLIPSAVLAQTASKQEEALKARVQEFYRLLQVAQPTDAEPFVTKDTLDNFRNTTKKAFVSYELESVKVEPDGKTGTAKVNIQTIIPFSTTPAMVPVTTQWKLQDGDWRVVMPKPQDMATLKDAFEQAKKQKNEPPPPPDELKFKGKKFGFGIIAPGQIKVARFPFTNVTDHVVTLREVLTGCDCLTVKTEKKEYKPGESGEVVIQFDPTGIEDLYRQTILVRTDPGGLKTLLNVDGFVQYKRDPAPKEPEKKPSE